MWVEGVEGWGVKFFTPKVGGRELKEDYGMLSTPKGLFCTSEIMLNTWRKGDFPLVLSREAQSR